MSARSLLLCFFSLLLLLVPILCSRAATESRVVEDDGYIRLPSSSQLDNTAQVHDHFVDDGEGGDFSYGSFSGVDLTQAPPSPPSYLILSISWPKAIAQVTAVRNVIPKMFTIHGLWGSNGDEKCPKVTTDLSLFKDPLKSQLKTYWVNAKAKSKVEYEAISSALTFWLYEYGKHGGCTNLDQVSYFQKTMDMYLRYGVRITNAVYNTKYKFQIDNGQAINTVELWNYINTGLGVKTVMTCAKNTNFIQEIRLYIRTSDWTAVDYPGAKRCTSETVKFIIA